MKVGGLVALVATASCGGGGGDETASTPTPQPPTLSELALSTDSVELMTGGGLTAVVATVRFTDRDGDVDALRVSLSDGTTATIPIVASAAANGQAVGDISLRTSTAAKLTIQVWLTDRAGNASNRMSGVVTVKGSADLSALTLSSGDLAPAFTRARKQYAASVDFATTSIAVTAQTLEQAAAVRINGAAAAAGTPIALLVGENSIAIDVTSSDGVTTTYSIVVRRRANAKLASLSLSVGAFDQIFQPGISEYTATVGLLRPTTTVTASAEDPAATVSIEGKPVISGTPSDKVTLDRGRNAIAVTVTAVDGTTQTYTADVTRRDTIAQEIYIKSDTPSGRPMPRTYCCPDVVGDLYGDALALDGDRLVVGAWGEENVPQFSDSGGVHIYERSGGTWRKATKLVTPRTVPNYQQHFGVNVALSGARLLVAEITSPEGGRFGHGPVMSVGVHVFTQTSNQWLLDGTLVPTRPYPPVPPMSRFGWALASEGDTLVVGDPWGSNTQMSSRVSGPGTEGDAFVFIRTASGWVQTQRLTSPAPDYHEDFGNALALEGDTLVIGAPGEDIMPDGTTGNSPDSVGAAGAVFVFRRQLDGLFTHETMLTAPNRGPLDRFGGNLVLAGDTLIVAADGEDSSAVGIDGDPTDDGAANSGAVFVYRRDQARNWTLEAYLKASNTGAGDGFGGRPFGVARQTIVFRDDVLVVGAGGEDSGAVGVNGDQSSNAATDSGAAYVFTRDAERRWTQVAYLKASNTDPLDEFGTIALDGDLIAVGAPMESGAVGGLNADQSNNGTHGDAGAVYVFR